MSKAKVIPFPTDKVRGYQTRSVTSIYKIFPKDMADSFVKYQEMAIEWRENIKEHTLYDGYPTNPPCEPIREDMVWYCDEKKKFGVWIVNQSSEEIKLNDDIEFGWTPFVRKSTAPPHEPVHIQSAKIREQLAWIVDSDGFGQYGMVQKNGTLWVPEERPFQWPY